MKLILFEHAYGDGYIGFDENKIIVVRAINNQMLLSLLMNLRRKGIAKEIEYIYKGQKRKRIVFKAIKRVEDVLQFLEVIKVEYGIYNVQVVENE